MRAFDGRVRWSLTAWVACAAVAGCAGTAPAPQDEDDARHGSDTTISDVEAEDTVAQPDAADALPSDTVDAADGSADGRDGDAGNGEGDTEGDGDADDRDLIDPADTIADAPDDTATDVGGDDGSADTGEDAPSVDADADVMADVPDECPAPASVALPASRLDGPGGTWESIRVGSFTDDYLTDPTSYIKVATRREWGGSIVFFGLDNDSRGPNNSNTIDANDTGREVQVAFYDPARAMQGCAHDASCGSGGTSCPASIRYLGWNPVQGGNRCNIGSGVDSVAFDDGTLTVVTTPLQWNPDWAQTTCGGDGCSDPARRALRSDVRVTQQLRFIRTHVVELTYTLENLSDLDHGLTVHELPTLYTANGDGGPDLWRLFDARGDQIAIDVPAGNEDGFFYKNFTSASSWVTMQNDTATYGVGLYMENGLRSFQGWQLRSLPFNNVRALFGFALPAHGTIRARAYLILGALGTVTTEAAWLDSHIPPFGSLDSPPTDGVVGETMGIGGWALDNRAVTRVFARVDGVTEFDMSLGIDRPDVCAVWPGYPSCPRTGFGGSVNLAAFGDTRCAHVVDVIAEDADGNQALIGRRTVRGR